ACEASGDPGGVDELVELAPVREGHRHLPDAGPAAGFIQANRSLVTREDVEDRLSATGHGLVRRGRQERAADPAPTEVGSDEQAGHDAEPVGRSPSASTAAAMTASEAPWWSATWPARCPSSSATQAPIASGATRKA